MAQFNSFQKEVAREYLTTRNNIAVMSSAGSGKTTLLCGLAQRIKKPNSFTFLAFTNATAEVLKKRLPKLEHAIQTTYSLGYKNVRNYLPAEAQLEVHANKAMDTYDELINGDAGWESTYMAASGMLLDQNMYETKRQVCELQRLSLLNCFIEIEDIYEFAHQLNAGWGHTNSHLRWYSKLAHKITKVNYELLMDEYILDFAEMIAWPAMWDDLLPVEYDEIFIDEFQDLSVAQQTLVFKSLRKGGQIVMVGDKSQAIYGFAGADHNSADSMVEMFNAKKMPMPINYRCGFEIIKHAQELDPVIQAHEGAPAGKVLEATPGEALVYIMDNQRETLVLGRTNLVLIKLAMKLLKLDRQFTFKRDILQERLNGLISRATGANPKVEITSFKPWLQLQIDFANEKKLSSQLDLLECLDTFYDSYRPKTWAQFKRSIKKFFDTSSKQSNLTLSTIHAAKGDEACIVVYYGTNLVPHRLSTTAAELQQEANLEYIARTRAKEVLVRVNLED